jgi:L-lactate dehydrogenase
MPCIKKVKLNDTKGKISLSDENTFLSSMENPLAFKVAIIGAGHVGATFAYSLLLSGLAGEIVLIDANKKRAEGEVMDLNHSVPLTHPARVRQGDFSDCAGAHVVVVSAGTPQREGETRLDLLQRNIAVFKDIIPAIIRNNRDGILLIATNPVDILSYAAWKLSGFPASRVIGAGTVLDTARFRAILSSRLSLDPRNVHAYVIGEHGDAEVPVWSLANIAGMTLDEYCMAMGCEIEKEERAEIARQVRDAAYEIIARKGSTHFAVAAGLLRIVESILRSQNSILTVSNLVSGYYEIDDVYLSLPGIINERGVRNLLELNLDFREQKALRDSAQAMRAQLDALDLSKPPVSLRPIKSIRRHPTLTAK